MSKSMLINARESAESRIAIMEDGRLQEISIERACDTRLLGNIYKGRVINVEPSFQAAFVDFGERINGFLHVSDVMPVYGDRNGSGAPMPAARQSTGKRDITGLLRPGNEVLVQVTKEPIGNKGPSLTTYVSLPGRYLVLMPSISRCGVSKKIDDDARRRRLRALLAELDPPKGLGYIVRTAGAGRTVADLERDLNYLLKVWRGVVDKVKSERAPAPLYREGDLVIRAIRDMLTTDIDEILIDDPAMFEHARAFLEDAMPERQDRLKLYDRPAPLFDAFQVENEIEKLYERKVTLRSGASIVIEQTEALIAIDINSGKFKSEKDAEHTAFKTNLEAIPEIARQLRLRDLGGVVVIDFIDMLKAEHIREVRRALLAEMKKDRARTTIGRMSQFCLLEMTRQRIRHSLRILSHETCPVCQGGGLVNSLPSMGLKALRVFKRLAQRQGARRVEVHAQPKVALHIANTLRTELLEIERETGRELFVQPDPELERGELRAVTLRADGKKSVELA